MRVLVACEFSGIVRDAFAAKGHYALSCDLEPSEKPGNHFQGNVLDVLDDRWDLMIAHPPCTYLSCSGAKHFKNPGRKELQDEALEFVEILMDAPIGKIAIENPVGVISSKIRKPDQIIQPYEFGEPHAKRTCLWLKNLPKLEPTEIVKPEYITLSSGKRLPKWYSDAKKSNAGQTRKLRSRTFEGIAKAMAETWG